MSGDPSRSMQLGRLTGALWALSALVLAAGDTPSGWSHGAITPMSKVMELLHVLKGQVEKEGTKDGVTFNKYTEWYMNESAKEKAILERTTDSIEDLEASIEEEQALQASESDRHTKVANKLSVSETELSKVTAQRKKEHAAFEENEKTLDDAVSSLTMSLEVLGADQAAQPKKTAASFVDVAKRLRSTLLQDHDARITDAQRKTLDGLLQYAVYTRRHKRKAQVLDFLQVRSQDDEPYGEYERQSGGAVGTLQSVLKTSQDELDAARKDEAKAVADFKNLSASYEEQITADRKTLSDIKTTVAHSQSRQSRFEGELASAKQVLKATQEGLVKIQADYSEERSAFKERAYDRTLEEDALRNATKVLSSDTAKTILDVSKGDGSAEATASFLQTSSASSQRKHKRHKHKKRKALGILRRSPTPGMALLALQAHEEGGRMTSDPFKKIKSMVFDMLTNLQEEAAKEADQHGWCTKEMGESTISHKSKSEKLETISNRLEGMRAELEDVKNDMSTVGKDLQSLREAVASATQVRSQEGEKNKHAIQQYKDAQGLVSTAITVLKKYYKSIEESSGRGPRNGMGAGVVALLEITETDFAKLQKVAEDSENTAQAQFDDLMSESQVRIVSFEKDVEYLTRNKVQLERDISELGNDQKGYQSEVKAVGEYIEKLKGQCIAKVESYDERKQRRESELESLKEALEYLQSDD
eukprot:TRINITY_DN9459_c0_g1_i2.p1 TRINITY_DN9459_c0_g1~~TRINITY_DN9459_c0_g1_i2.p1  ORF type:complete len:703 (+),score=181.83 TRINITY_DN9459_c0_g1_i2:64-2172(+)